MGGGGGGAVVTYSYEEHRVLKFERMIKDFDGVTRENHRPVVSHWQNLSHNVVSSKPHHERGSNSQVLVVIGTCCIGSY